MLGAKVQLGMNALVAVMGLGGVGLCTNAAACLNGSVLVGVDRVCVSWADTPATPPKVN